MRGLRNVLTRIQKRRASNMVIESSRLSVLHGPLQPHTRRGDAAHPTGFFRDGFCWGSEEDLGRHYVAGVVTKEFLDYSKSRGNDLSSPRPGFAGLSDGCRWCLCVERWKEAMVASERLGERVVPRVDLAATAMDTLRWIGIDDLLRFQHRPGGGGVGGGEGASGAGAGGGGAAEGGGSGTAGR